VAPRAEVIDPKIAEHHCRIVKTTGAGFLVEFASVVDVLRGAARSRLQWPESNY
jgi:adenylate cyclase